jgi:hypothetical protein
MGLAERLLVARARGATRAAARERRRALEAELAGYASDRDVRDLAATLDRYPDAATQEVRDILSRQARARQARRSPTVGGMWPLDTHRRRTW